MDCDRIETGMDLVYWKSSSEHVPRSQNTSYDTGRPVGNA